MSLRQLLLRLWFPILLLGAGMSAEEQVKSRLGDYAFFRVTTNVSIDSISWSKIVSGESENIAAVTFGGPCGLLVPHPAYETRVRITYDCRALFLDRTEKEDAGRYTAEVISRNNTAVTESFDLRVFRIAKTEYVKGIYGESLVFQVKNNLSFVSINWLKIVENKFENISLVTFGQPCGLLVIHPDFENRVKASEDCSGLQLSPLEQDDIGDYSAEIVLTTGETIYEPFKLEIDRYLRDSEMRVTCTPVGAKRRTWQLSCSTGDEKDRVEFDWESPIYRPYIAPHPRVIKVNSWDLNVNVTCTAENLISKASRRVSLKDVCSGPSGEEQVNSRLGGFAVFRVKSNVSIDSISWSKMVSGKSENIAVVTFGEPCGLLVPLPAYETRVNLSNDCRALFFDRTRKEDAGRYTAEVISQNNTAVNESFDLRLFRYLLDSEMRVTCTPDGTKNGTWQLRCSTAEGKDQVEFNWESRIIHPFMSSDTPVIKVKSRNLNVKVTCTAENPISKASRRVSLKDVCSGTSGEEQVNSRLGGFAFFRVNTNVSIDSISWSKTVSGESEKIAVVTAGEPCGLLVPLPAYETRVDVSNDCRALFFERTEKEDAGRYTAEVISRNNTAVTESFDLHLFRRLLDSEIRVTCTPVGARRRTWQLSCSTGDEKDRVEFNWESRLIHPYMSPDTPVIKVNSRNLNVKVTCTAENPISKASRRVALKDVCFGHGFS